MRRQFKWLFALAGVWLALWAGDRAWGGRGVAAAEPEKFVADLAIRQGRVLDGRPDVQWLPPKQVRIEREKGPRAWKTTLTWSDGGRVTGISDDGDGEPLRFIDRTGERRSMAELPGLTRLLGGPDAVSAFGRAGAGRRRRLDTDWMDAFVATPKGRDRRARAVSSALGVPRGQVRGLDRYLSSDGRTTREVLLDPASLVPIEVNDAVDGRLQSRTTMAYQPDARGALTRTGMRIEQRADRDTAVIDVQYTNIRLPKGGWS